MQEAGHETGCIVLATVSAIRAIKDAGDGFNKMIRYRVEMIRPD